MTTKNRAKTNSSRSGARRGTKTRGAAGARPSRAAARPSLAARLWGELTDGRGHDLVGLLMLILAIVAGASIYSGAAKAPGSWPDTVFGVLLGALRYAVPPLLVVVGIILIRGPRPAMIDLADEDEPWYAPARRHSEAVRGAGLFLGLLVVAGILDVLLAEGRTISADGWDAYRGGGGLLGALVGALAVLGGRWVALAILVLVGIFCVSLISGLPLRELGRRLWRLLSPGVHLLLGWLAALFHINGARQRTNDGSDTPGAVLAPGGPDTDPTTVTVFDQDADATASGSATDKPKRRAKAPAAPKEPAVVIAGQRAEDTGETEQLQIDLDLTPEGSHWRLPPLSLLSRSGAHEVDKEAVAERGRRLEGALAEHGVETRLIGMTVGPAATRYELELGVAVKVGRVTALHKDIAYAMATPDVRILAPIPGRRAIGVEVPNDLREIVTLGDVLSSTEARNARHPLEVGIGRGMNGENVMLNLASTPHLLIAGQTGAGKSSCINSILTSIMLRATPDQVRLILIDPKQVELTQYRKIPHLLTQVVTDPKKAANALSWATTEMDRRYTFLSEIGVRDIGGYNKMFQSGELAERFPERELKRMPFIVVVVDELSDLMLVAAKEVEHSITRIASKARAVGIHLVLATQRPSADVITGLIKANVPARLSFTVASAIDSKVILDQTGAERLTGKGDMLLLAGNTTPHRIQGAWVEESEVRAIASQWQRQAPQVEESYVEEIVDGPGDLGGGVGAAGGYDDDELLLQALELVVRGQLGSTSMLQRKLKVGFARAGRLMDLLEERGVVGPSEGSKARAVLMTPDELDRMIEAGEI